MNKQALPERSPWFSQGEADMKTRYMTAAGMEFAEKGI